MNGPTTRASSQPSDNTIDAAGDALAREERITFRIQGDEKRGQKSGYSILLQGEIEASSILSSNDPDASVTLLEDDTKLLSGSVRGGTAGFILEGKILAAEFDEPKPTVKLGGALVETDRWPTVKAYTGYGPGQEPVEDPFPNSGELGKPRGDPLDPQEYVITLDANGLEKAESYCFDIDGEITGHPDSATISDEGDRVYGYLYPGWSSEIEMRGAITRIDTGSGIDFSVDARD